MNSFLQECVDEYKKSGTNYFKGEKMISGWSEFDLWMGVRQFKYEVRVRSETYQFFGKDHVVYYCDVRITDTYNFNIGYSYVVEEYVACFSYNDNFIAVRKLDVPDHTMFEDIIMMDFNMAMYYLINAQNGEVLGPFPDKEAFETACAEQETGILGEWIPTYPAPTGANF